MEKPQAIQNSTVDIRRFKREIRLPKVTLWGKLGQGEAYDFTGFFALLDGRFRVPKARYRALAGRLIPGHAAMVEIPMEQNWNAGDFDAICG
jgi:hypothetical protein